MITFITSAGYWEFWQYQGTDSQDWATMSSWKRPGSIEEVQVSPTIEDNGGEPQAEVNFNSGVLQFLFKNLKLRFSDLTNEEKESLRGPQGASAVFDPQTGNILATLENTLGESDSNAMTQKAVTEQIGKALVIYRETAPDNSERHASTGYWRYEWLSLSAGDKLEVSASEGYEFSILSLKSSSTAQRNITGGYVTSASETLRPIDSPEGDGTNIWVRLIIRSTNGTTVTEEMAAENINCVCYVDTSDSDNLTRRIEKLEEDTHGFEYRNPIAVDLSEAIANQRPCSHGTTFWYKKTKGTQAHIALVVEPGKTYKMRAKDGGSYAAVLTDAYDPEVAYTNNTPLPLASCNDERIVVPGWRYVTIPDDGVYLTLTTIDGSGVSHNWEVYEVTPVEIEDAPQNVPVKIRVMQWNVGHWAMGSSANPTLTPEQFDAKKMLYRKMINDVAADVVCCCEWSEYVDNQSQGMAKDVLFGNYDSLFQSPKPSPGSYMQTAILSNGLKLTSVQRVLYPSDIIVLYGRYYSVATYRINGHDVKIVATHLEANIHGDDPVHAAWCRGKQIETLINAFAEDLYVILCADYNVASGNEYQVFSEAGYDMANCGYLGDIPTAGNVDEQGIRPIDNIIFKGFKPSKIEMYDGYNSELPKPYRVLSDHSPIAVTLTMIE
jgi:endonuclease/exonuclease/phosphatase family metal-dependent hydrolase